jgi:hypothetical protein
MTAADSINARDRDLVRRLLVVVAAIFVLTAAFSLLARTYSQKFYDITGRAQWIWARHRMSDNMPLAFFAARDFDLPERRIFTHLKVLGDPEYAVYVNGREIAGRRVGEERTLDVYDISELVKTGRNRVVVSVRAPRGVGGLIAAIDIAPETANWVVTNGEWKIFRQWRPEILTRDPADLPWEAPVVIGEPPIGRWNYLTVNRLELRPPPATTVQPRQAFEQMGFIPRIRTTGGVAVAVAERARATAFDFGFTKGRIRLVQDDPSLLSRAVNVRFAFAAEELPYVEWNLRPIVFAPGEREVTTPEVHDFRYAMVFAKGIRAELVN